MFVSMLITASIETAQEVEAGDDQNQRPVPAGKIVGKDNTDYGKHADDHQKPSPDISARAQEMPGPIIFRHQVFTCAPALCRCICIIKRVEIEGESCHGEREGEWAIKDIDERP